MKKSELTQLTQIIEVLVQREIKKQLPRLIGEVFQSMAGKSMVTEHIQPTRREVEPSVVPKDPNEFRASLKELFAGATPVTKAELEEGIQIQPQRAVRQYTKDPVLNQILNETTSDLKSRERMTGLAAFQGGYNPGMPSAGAGPMMSEAEMPAFARGMPQMPQMPAGASIPVGRPPVLQEGQESPHAPLSAIPEGVSALDVAKAGIAPPAVTEALTNYDRMKKILEASKGKRY